MRLNILTALLGAFVAYPQTEPRFDVASIKPARAEEIAAGISGIRTGHGRAVGTNVTLKRCIVGSYHIAPRQVVGGPSWLDTDRFDFEAKAAEPVNEDSLFDAMIRSLLAERFHLTVHRETRQLNALVLTVSKRGPRLEKAGGGESSTDAGHGSLKLRNSTMDALAERIARSTELPVMNETGLIGVFDLELTWTPDGDRPKSDSPPSLPTALREQLGLQLVSRRVPVGVLVIDHVERPGEN